MKFIFFLSANIALTTFFQSAWPAVALNIVVFLIMVLLSCISDPSHRRRFFFKTGGVLLGAFLVSMTSLFWAHKKVISESSSHYLGTGEIIEKQTGRYLFLTPSGEKFLYYSDVTYEVGTVLFAAGSLQEATGEKNLLREVSWKNMRERGQTLSDEEWGFDKNKRLLMRGRQGSLYEKQASVVGKKPIPRIQRQREQLVKLLEKPYDKQTLGLTLGMLIGDRSYLTKEEYHSFISSGLVHIVAVSGGNIVLIVAFLSAILFFIPYYIRLVLISVAIVVYAAICGFDSSVVRAVIMALIGMMALFVGRGVSIWRSVGYVYVGMLVWNPYYLLYDLGFIFSFSAIIGLVYFSARWKVKTTKKIWQGSVGKSAMSVAKSFWNVYVLPSISASLGVSGALLFFTNHVNLLSIVSNILVVPLVPFVMIYGFFAAIFYSVIRSQSLGQLIALPQERAVSRIHTINTRGVDHAMMLNALTGSARLLVGSAVIACVMIVKFARKRIV